MLVRTDIYTPILKCRSGSGYFQTHRGYFLEIVDGCPGNLHQDARESNIETSLSVRASNTAVSPINSLPTLKLVPVINHEANHKSNPFINWRYLGKMLPRSD